MKKLFKMLAMVMMGVMAVACTEKEDSGKTVVSEEGFYGEWKMVKYVFQTEYQGKVLESIENEIQPMSYEFRENGEGAAYYNNESGQHIVGDLFTWSYQDGILTIKFVESMPDIVFEVEKQSKDKLVLCIVERDENTMVVKQIMTLEKIK